MDGDYTGAKHTYIFETLQGLGEAVAPYRFVLGTSTIKKLLKRPDPMANDPYRTSTFLSCYSRKTRDDLRKRKKTAAMVYQPSDWKTSEHNITTEKETKETWHQVVVRVIEGTFSHYVSHMHKIGQSYCVTRLSRKASKMALSMIRMEWTPPGRGLYAMGTIHSFTNGSAALNNCYAVTTGSTLIDGSSNNLARAASWAMDMLMNGGGVGFDTMWDGEAVAPNKEDPFTYVIPDTRQGWVSALELIIRAYVPIDGKISNKFPVFDYSLIRKYGEPIHGFGGTASGPGPLKMLLKQVEIYFDTFIAYQKEAPSSEEEQKKLQTELYTKMVDFLHENEAFSDKPYDYEALREEVISSSKEYEMPYDRTRLVADVFNSIGFCVVSGNVRRSAQICLGRPGDKTFLNLKRWEMHPLRRQIMHLSNNTVCFWNNADFEKHVSSIADRIRDNGEPGIANMINIQKYGRFSDTTYGPDDAILLNPCAEIPLVPYEPCCLGTVVPMNCLSDGELDYEKLHFACKAATFYTTVVTTIRHHWSVTNDAIAPRRRIGVSSTGIAEVYEKFGVPKLITAFKSMYSKVREVNEKLTTSMKIPRSIRVSTVKPEGTISIVTGTSSGVHFPIISQGVRRIAYDNTSPVLKALLEANYESEEDSKSSSRTYIKFPYKSVGRAASKVGIMEKILLASLVQRHFADNSVSFTGDFNPITEADMVEKAIASNIPQMKVISMFGKIVLSEQYKHLPFEELPEETYLKSLQGIKEVDWSNVLSLEEDASKDGTAFCTSDSCQLPVKA